MFENDSESGEDRATEEDHASGTGFRVLNLHHTRRSETPSPLIKGGKKNHLVLTNETQFREIVEKLKESRETLRETNEQLERFLDPEKENEKRALSFWLSLIPAQLRQFAPERFVQSVPKLREKPRPLEKLEEHMRRNIGNVQDVMRDLAAAAMEKKDECTKLEEIITKAKKEEWSARELQEFIACTLDIQVDPTIQQLMNKDLDYLPDKEKKRQQKEILRQLLETSRTGRELMAVVQRVCVAGLDVLEGQMMQYFQYVFVLRPILTIEKAATEFTSADEAVYKSRVAIGTVAQRALEAIGVAIEAAGLADQFTIASPSMNAILSEGRLQIEEKAKLLIEKSSEPIDVESETSAALEKDGEA